MSTYGIELLSTDTGGLAVELTKRLTEAFNDVSTMAQKELLASLVKGTVIEACSEKSEGCDCEDLENCDCEDEKKSDETED